jgi:hypothetical protein
MSVQPPPADDVDDHAGDPDRDHVLPTIVPGSAGRDLGTFAISARRPRGDPAQTAVLIAIYVFFCANLSKSTGRCESIFGLPEFRCGPDLPVDLPLGGESHLDRP